MPDYSLNWTARSNAIHGGRRCQCCSLPTRGYPSRSRGPFGLKSAMEHWPSGSDAIQSTEHSAKYPFLCTCWYINLFLFVLPCCEYSFVYVVYIIRIWTTGHHNVIIWIFQSTIVCNANTLTNSHRDAYNNTYLHYCIWIWALRNKKAYCVISAS